MNKHLFILILVWALAACGGVSSQPPAIESQALSHHLRGTELRRQGELSAAQRSFSDAYRLYASVEAFEGSSAALLNLAALARQQRAYEMSEAYLAQAGSYAIDKHKGTLAYETALLMLQRGHYASAKREAQNALQADATLAGQAKNLMARACYRLKDATGARSHLREAMQLLNSENTRRELANAYRLLGRLEIDAGDPVKAQAVLEQALLLDRELNLPDKLVLDLLLLADAARANAAWRAEADYLRRLFVVRVNHSGEESGKEILSRLADLLESQNRGEMAQDLRRRADDFVKLGIVPLDW